MAADLTPHVTSGIPASSSVLWYDHLSLPSTNTVLKQPYAPQCPPLPIEVWAKIISYTTTRSARLSHLWHTLRATSHLLRNAVEMAFRDTHLPFAVINTNANLPHPDLTFRYGRLDQQDSTRAIFDIDEEDSFGKYDSHMIDLVGDEWVQKLDGDMQGPEFWRHDVHLRGLKNCTCLPDVRIRRTPGNLEISVKWTRMLDELLGEDLLARQLRNEWAVDNWHHIYHQKQQVCDLYSASDSEQAIADEVLKDTFRRARKVRIDRWHERREREGNGMQRYTDSKRVTEIAFNELERVLALKANFNAIEEVEGPETDMLLGW